jgi:hypothetical protein
MSSTGFMWMNFHNIKKSITHLVFLLRTNKEDGKNCSVTKFNVNLTLKSTTGEWLREET